MIAFFPVFSCLKSLIFKGVDAGFMLKSVVLGW
jgi:hypothetical protein